MVVRGHWRAFFNWNLYLREEKIQNQDIRVYWGQRLGQGVKGRDILGQFSDWLSVLTDSFFIGLRYEDLKHDR